MAKWLALLCSVLAISLVAAGCGGEDEEGGGGGGEAKEEPAGGGGGGEAKKREEVALIDTQFRPSAVTVVKGGKVEWGNVDSVGHDVTKRSGPGPDFSSGEPGGMAQGDTFSQTFDTPGTIQYVCTVHANMKGTVTVK